MSMLTPESAWTPLPASEWTLGHARHLASRLGFSINPALVKAVAERGPAGTLQAYLKEIRPLTSAGHLVEMSEMMGARYDEIKEAAPEEKRQMRQELQKANRKGYQQYAIDWYTFAREPRNSPQEKLVLFFQDVWVVAFAGVRRTPALMDYQQRIRSHLGSSYPEMCKDLATSPAMVRYLNLNQSRKGSPNENFARELFELFCLGEGNYSETDIKEAARAMTGWTVNQSEEVRFYKGRHDGSLKTIFDKTGNFDMDGVIDLVFEQPAAARFLPKELVRYYLTEEGLGNRMIQPLADSWKASGYSLPHLISTFFTSRIFYEPGFQGNMIKTPVQYYLGLLQDLDLDVFPSPRRTNNMLRTMGQQFYNPPNVRGWVGGRNWINSATLASRRQLVQSLLQPVPTGRLNADEEEAVARAEAAGKATFTLTREQLKEIAGKDLDLLAESFSRRFYIQPETEALREVFDQLQKTREGAELGSACLAATLTAPPYHLC
jgi:uncharacterized protein (DUF1800 family)